MRGWVAFLFIPFSGNSGGGAEHDKIVRRSAAHLGTLLRDDLPRRINILAIGIAVLVTAKPPLSSRHPRGVSTVVGVNAASEAVQPCPLAASLLSSA